MLLDCHSPVYHDVTNVYQLHTKRETLGLSVTTVTLQHQPCWISLTKVTISVKNVYKLAVESIHWGQQTVVHENSSLNKTVYFGHFPNSGQYKEENILGGFRGLLRERLKIQTNQSQIWNIHWISDTMVYFFYVDLLSGSDSCCLQLQFGII